MYEVAEQLGNRPSKYDYVLFDNLEYLPVAYAVSRILGIPLIARERGDGWSEVRQKEKTGGYRLPGARRIMDLYGAVLRRCVAVFCVSEYLKKQVKKNAQIMDRQLFNVPISVNTDAYATSKNSKSDDRSAKSELTLLLVTNFRYPEKVKKIEEFMPAIAALLISNPDTRFLIAGDGPYLRIFKENIHPVLKGVSDRVILKGYVHNIHQLYRKADITFYLSGLDAFPRALLESMAASCPVIANPFGGIPEIIQHGKNGFLVDSQEAFLYYAHKLIDDVTLRRAIGRTARKHICQLYTPEQVGKKWLEAFAALDLKY